MLPQKIRHRRISSGSRSFFASSSAPPSAPPARAVSEGFRNEPLTRETPTNAVDLPPKLPRKASFGSRNDKTSGTSVGSASFSGSVGFVSTPTGTSVASASLASFNSEESKKGKRKRREFARDERWAGVRRVVEDLNKAIGPEKRRIALSSALLEFSHTSAPKHTASLYLGAADALTLLLSMSDDEDEIATIASALEMVYRGEKEGIIYSYRQVGAALVPLCLRLLERAERRGKAMEGTMCDISKVLLYMTRISELRTSLVGHPGMLGALERVGNVPGVENRELRMRILANLANSESNKTVIFGRATLLESVLKVAILDKSDCVREYASAVLMDLASCPANQVAMARIDKVLATFVKLAVVEDKVETREYAVSGLQNLAFEKKNRVQLVSYGNGVVVEALKKTISSDSNEKTRRRSAGALTNLACDETANKMGCHEALLQTLAKVAVSDSNKDVQQRATLALTKLANSVTIDMPCWGLLLDALIDASKCPVGDGIVSAMFRVKTRSEENRTSMASHPRLLETLAYLCLTSQDAPETPESIKDCENATKAIAHLANEPNNHKLICNKHVLAALVHGASLPPSHAITRDAAILAMERMAMEHSNRPMMARYPGMLVTIAKATEREMKEEASGMSVVTGTGQPRLAKPLLMSLLVAL
ncbi:hypothetical protein ACHAWX_005560 [Stephanocyclus meneghinianus]